MSKSLGTKHCPEASFLIMDSQEVEAVIPDARFYEVCVMNAFTKAETHYNAKVLGTLIPQAAEKAPFFLEACFWWRFSKNVAIEYSNTYLKDFEHAYIVRLEKNVAVLIKHTPQDATIEFEPRERVSALLQAPIVGYATQIALSNIILGPKYTFHHISDRLDAMPLKTQHRAWFDAHKSIGDLLPPTWIAQSDVITLAPRVHEVFFCDVALDKVIFENDEA